MTKLGTDCDRGFISIVFCLPHTLPRRQPSPKPKGGSPGSENASDTNLLLCATCGKEKLWTQQDQIVPTLFGVHM